MSLVIKKWYASETVNEENNYVHLHGRASGLMSWILSKLSIDPTVELQISEGLIKYSTSSFSGTDLRLIPLKSISSISYSFEKPWKSALGIALLSIGLGQFSIWLVLVGLILSVVYYFFNKTLTIAANEASGYRASFSFSPSLIEDVDINETEAKRVVQIITQLLTKKD